MSKSISIASVAKRLVLLLLSAFVLVLSQAAAVFAATPFGSQYGNPAATGGGHLLPSTGGPLLFLALLGIVLLCCGSALLVRRAMTSRR